MKKHILVFAVIMLLFPISIYASPKYLYDVLKVEAESGTFAREYTGTHGDSMDTSLSTQKIYHWYANNNSDGNSITDRNNVLFANHCWKMIRTTDTGGVKLIYNGEPNNNKCFNSRNTHIGYSSRTRLTLEPTYFYGTSYSFDGTNFALSGNITTGAVNVGEYTCKQTTENGTCTKLYYVMGSAGSLPSSSSSYLVYTLESGQPYSQIGTLPFNEKLSTMVNSGYMYNTNYGAVALELTGGLYVLDSLTANTSYWYADSITWGNPVAENYSLVNPYQISSSDDYKSLVGKFTLLNASETHSSPFAHYIAAVVGSTIYTINMDNRGNHTFEDFNHTYTYGDSYIDNGDGTYTINNPITINRSDWYTNYNNIGEDKFLCINAVNNTCSDLWHTTSTSEKKMYGVHSSNTYKYAKGFTYDENTGKYILNAESVNIWDIADRDTYREQLKNAHYTCWNLSGECSQISYLYYSYTITPERVLLKDGKNIEDIIEEMLSADNVNLNDSTIKKAVDAWYKNYIYDKGYDNFIEDTIFCNDRSITSLGGWNPNGGSVTDDLLFKENANTTDLNCTNITDRFSVSNTRAKLTYKVGLMSGPEMQLLSNDNIRKTGQKFWLVSPVRFGSTSLYVRSVDSNGKIAKDGSSAPAGVRPSISLKPKIRYLSGNGSMSSPYTIDYNTYYAVNIDNNTYNDFAFYINDLESILENQTVQFRVNPPTGYKVKRIEIKENDELLPYEEKFGLYSFTMPANDVTITPTYEKIKYKVNVVVKNETKDLDVNIEDLTSVFWGDVVSFKITSIEGYKLAGVTVVDHDNNSVDYKIDNSYYSFTMPANDVTITPSYRKISSSITVEDNELGKIKIEVNNSSAIIFEEKVVFTITPEKGYKVNNIIIIDKNNNNVNYNKNDNEYSFIMPASDVLIRPFYKKVSNPVNIIKDEKTSDAKVEIENPKEVEYESIVRVKIIPKSGYEINSLIIKDEEDSSIEYKKTVNNNEYEFVMPASAVSIVPIYRKMLTSDGGVIIPDTWANNLLIAALVLIVISGTTYFIISRKSKIM